MIDPGWLGFLRLLILRSRLKAIAGLMSGLVTSQAASRQRAGLHVLRGIGWAITGAAQSVFLHPQYLGGGFRCFLPPRTGSGPPLGSTRLASAGGGVEGSRWRLRFVGNGGPWGEAIEGSDRIGGGGLTSVEYHQNVSQRDQEKCQRFKFFFQYVNKS